MTAYLTLCAICVPIALAIHAFATRGPVTDEGGRVKAA